MKKKKPSKEPKPSPLDSVEDAPGVFFARLKLCEIISKSARNPKRGKADAAAWKGLGQLARLAQEGDEAALAMLVVYLTALLSWLDDVSAKQPHRVKKLSNILPIWPALVSPRTLSDTKKHLEELGCGEKCDFPQLNKTRQNAPANRAALAALICHEAMAIELCSPIAGAIIGTRRLTKQNLKEWWKTRGYQMFREFLKENPDENQRYINPKSKGTYASEDIGRYAQKCFRALERLLPES